MKCLYCGRETERKFCNHEHKKSYIRRTENIVPIIANRDFISPKEQGWIDAYLKKNRKKMDRKAAKRIKSA